MLNFLVFLMILILWLAGALNYIVAGIIKLHYPKGKLLKDYANQPTLSILLPCYNEGPAVYDTIKSIKASNYPEDKLEVIVTDDFSVDDSWEWIVKAQADFTNVRAIRNPENLGKTETILNAMNASDRDIVMVVDSDTVLHPDAIREVMACFADPQMGAVGVPASVKNPDDNALTAYQTAVYFSGFRIYRIPQCHMQNVGCIGGYALAIRRYIFKDIEADLRARRWFGTIVNDGEDRFITHLILLRGFRTYQDAEAKCWTSVPNRHDKYWGQQLRWRRTFIRDFTWTIRTLPGHIINIHPSLFHTYVLLPLSLLIAGANLVLLATVGGVPWFDFAHVMGYCGMTFLALALARRHQPDQDLKHPLAVFIYAPWWIVNNLFLTIAAAMTLDCGDWGNRSKKIISTGESQ